MSEVRPEHLASILADKWALKVVQSALDHLYHAVSVSTMVVRTAVVVGRKEAMRRKLKSDSHALVAGSMRRFRLGRGGRCVGCIDGTWSCRSSRDVRAPLRMVVAAVISTKPPSTCSFPRLRPRVAMIG